MHHLDVDAGQLRTTIQVGLHVRRGGDAGAAFHRPTVQRGDEEVVQDHHAQGGRRLQLGAECVQMLANAPKPIDRILLVHLARCAAEGEVVAQLLGDALLQPSHFALVLGFPPIRRQHHARITGSLDDLGEPRYEGARHLLGATAGEAAIGPIVRFPDRLTCHRVHPLDALPLLTWEAARVRHIPRHPLIGVVQQQRGRAPVTDPHIQHPIDVQVDHSAGRGRHDTP
mmetsp:Transcript_39268/g.113508  ORF Transcript_39268/g.113508 Transcript_39268/m.113508 type:complete len:227 (+) Transcript_39268:579-1259(+)